MSRMARVGIVCAGYLLAIAASWMAAYLYNARMAEMPYDTSGGMYAAGESMTAIAVFLAVASVPTLLALWFLRGHWRLWQAVAFASLAFAIAGLLGVLVFFMDPATAKHPAVLVLSLFGLAQLLGVPFWTAGFVLFTLLAPTGPAKRMLIAAVGIELVIGVCVAVHWLVPGAHL